MLLTIRKREKTYHADLLDGRVHKVRGSLGTRDHSAALRIKHRLEVALSEGSKSEVWAELRTMLPRSTYNRFAGFVGVKDRAKPTWNDLRDAYKVRTDQRVELWNSNPEKHIRGSLSPNTAKRYEQTIRQFEASPSPNAASRCWKTSRSPSSRTSRFGALNASRSARNLGEALASSSMWRSFTACSSTPPRPR